MLTLLEKMEQNKFANAEACVELLRGLIEQIEKGLIAFADTDVVPKNLVPIRPMLATQARNNFTSIFRRVLLAQILKCLLRFFHLKERKKK